MNLATWHYHIEISSKCALACPRCARSEVPETLINTQLNLEFFEKNFTRDILKDVEKITFCGDDGDPIYARDLIPVIRYLKPHNVQIVIVTNGSYKSELWWEDLGKELDENDIIHFSLDGWDNESNNIYRVGSDFDSAMIGLKTMVQYQPNVIWDAIAFKFNEDKINDMFKMAMDAGCDGFQLTKSTKFGSFYPSYGKNDPLEPSSKYVSTTNRFERSYWHIKREIKNKDIYELYRNAEGEDITPLCYIGTKGLFINSRGEFYPCCWVANRYAHNEDWQGKFNLYERSLPEILQDEFWDNEFKTFKWHECQTKCKSGEVTLETSSEW